jgi:hypothetical protein
MTNRDRELAAQFLLAARKRRTPGPRIPAQFRPADTDDAPSWYTAGSCWVTSRRLQVLLPSTPRPVLLVPIFAPAIMHASPCPVLAVGGPRAQSRRSRLSWHGPTSRATAYTESEVRDAIGKRCARDSGSRYSDPDSATFPEVIADGWQTRASRRAGASRSLE